MPRRSPERSHGQARAAVRGCYRSWLGCAPAKGRGRWRQLGLLVLTAGSRPGWLRVGEFGRWSVHWVAVRVAVRRRECCHGGLVVVGRWRWTGRSSGGPPVALSRARPRGRRPGAAVARWTGCWSAGGGLSAMVEEAGDGERRHGLAMEECIRHGCSAGGGAHSYGVCRMRSARRRVLHEDPRGLRGDGDDRGSLAAMARVTEV